jgi:hypothetical protein
MFIFVETKTLTLKMDIMDNIIFNFFIFKIFKVCILLREYNQYIPILPSTQQLFINIYSTTCFDPNGPSSGAARLTHSTSELYAHIYIHMVHTQKVTFFEPYTRMCKCDCARAVR